MKLKSLILRFYHGSITFPWLTSVFDRVFGPRGRILRFRTAKKWHSHPTHRRLGYLSLVALFSFSLLSESFLFLNTAGALDRITPEVKKLLVEPIPSFGNYLEFDSEKQEFVYNKGYQAGGGIFGTKGSPKFSASFPLDGTEARSIIDPSSGTAIKITPNFAVGNGQRDQNRVVYPIPGRDAIKVISLGGIGYKEDIVLNSYQGSSVRFSYELEIPSGVEARLEADGSVGFYGVEEVLLGNVSTGSDSDAKLLESARQNGEKTNLLFRIPSPYVVETNRKDSNVDTFFTLEGNTLTTVATNLRQASYPLSIDPSVYVETARKFMRGNNETNIDFDVDNELIQKGSTTGARFEDWTNTMSFSSGLTDGGSAIAGGYVYYLGGVGSAGVASSTEYTSTTPGTYSVPAGITQILIEMWGGGGGGGGGGTNGSNGSGGDGGGGAYATAVVNVSAFESLNVVVGGGGGRGDFSTGTQGDASGDGGGGGGHSEVNRSGTPLVIAAGGGGGGGGDNSGGTASNGAGGDGAPGGDATSGEDGSEGSTNAPGGSGATTGSGGSGGNGDENDGEDGGSEFGGEGADGASQNGGRTDGSKNNGGSNGGGDGGNGDQADGAGFAGGGGGGSGYYGGGGGSGSDSGQAGGGGGGSGVSYYEGSASNTSSASGSGTNPGNSGDSNRGGAGDGGLGGATSSSGTDGSDGKIIITPILNNETKAELHWANIDDNSGALTSPNPGDGACTDWCTDSAYDLPEDRRGFSLVAYNGFLYAIGGEDDLGNIEATVYIAKLGANGEPSLWHPSDPDKSNWVYWYEDTGSPLTTATKYGAAVAYNNRLYFMGGVTAGSPGGVTTVVYTNFNPTGTLSGWTTSGTAALSTSRFMHSAEVYNGYLYVVGGDSNATGALLNTVEYVKLAADGTFSSSWETTSSFSGARRSEGGSFTTIYGAYLYIMGGCTSVSSGNCQTIGDEIQIASIFADGSLGAWSTDSATTNQRLGYSLHSWEGNVYRLGGCITLNASGDCSVTSSETAYGVINPPGEVSTVNITEPSGSGDCTGGSPTNCDLPTVGDDAGELGHMLNMSVVLNGFLYVIGGCAEYDCNDNGNSPTNDNISSNTAHVSIASDGSLAAPNSCSGTSYGSWCVNSTNTINGANGVAAAGVTTFNNRIYIIGGIDSSGNTTGELYHNSVNPTTGELSGNWSTQDLGSAGITEDIFYTYAYARANPNEAGTYPGNLYVFGGCGDGGSGAGCANGDYETEVYKCNIETNGDIEEANANDCTTAGQLQIDSTPGSGGTDGLGIHSGTVYANYIYLIGGFSQDENDKDDVLYARFDDNNDVVAVSGSDWIESPSKLSIGRRRGWAFGYNGHIYAVGGYDQSGGGIIPFIEWAKINVSDGSLDSFVTSNVTINQRWGLSMVVSNSFAYVIGGCDSGASPSNCSSFEPSIQTFQLYNNDSGAQANYTESTGNFATLNSRIGSSAAILDGYIYVAGGENSGSVTNNVQYAPINPNGTIGSWSDTSASLPAGRAYGQLEAVGGSLYYVGGEDTGGDEKSEVYYATPTGGVATDDVIRSTTYKLNSTEFSGANYTLTLNNDLESDYFVMVAGGDDTGGASGPDSSQIRVDGDPFGNLTATTSSDEIRLERGSSDDNWNGSVTVVECVSSCATDGFQLAEVIDGTLPASDLSEDFTLGSAHGATTVPFGGYLGGGLVTSDTNQNNFNATAGVRVRKNSTNQIRVERNDTQGTAAAADITIYVVDWGSSWSVQEVNVDNWSEGGAGVNATGEYHQESISSVTGANTWVWKSPGTSEQNGLGDGAFGKVLALGDGVADPTGSVSEISLGSRYSDSADVRDDTVYVMESSNIEVDYRFHTESSSTSFTETVDSSIEPESVATVGNITSSEGYRIPLFYYSSTGTGTAYTRVAGYSNYYTNDSTVSISRDYTGQDNAGWLQSVDFGNMAGNAGVVDINTWSTASNGLPADRTRHGAAVWNDRIYVVAGLNDSGSETNTVYVSPKLSGGGNITSAWATNAVVPDVARSGGAVIAYANNIYLLGGNDGTNYLSDVQFASIGYKTGTIGQSGNTVTGVGTTFTSSMVGEELQYADGSTATITAFNSTTSLTVDASKTVTAGSRYLIDDGSVGNWTFTTSLPQYVSDADGFAANGFMYLFGGRSATSTCTNNSYVAPISANTTIATGNNPTGIGEWYQTNVEYTGDRYSAGVAYNEGKVYITGGGCGTELTSNQHYYGTLRSQPQVARYSYYVDADTNVFPNSWLLNGLDNNIGARWQFGYRSSTDANNAWGQDTDFGDVTLGRVEGYTPIDGSGVPTNFARYFYVTMSIDASQTFGYPDDVTRGPTIDDFTLFFTADPNKRLRHGKTFIQGVEQPLDTPCRVSGANPAGSQPNCPMP